MKKTLATLFSLLPLLIAPAPAFALFNVNQGGTGQAAFTSGALIYGNGTNPLATTTPGTLGYVLQFNGTFPTWVATSSLGLITHPAGNDREIQFNNNGSFGSDANLKWDGVNMTVGPLSGGIQLRSNNNTIGLGNGVDFNSTFISENSGALYLSGRASTTAVEIAGSDGVSSAILDTHLIVSGPGTPRFIFPDIPGPNGRGTFGILEINQKWTGTNTFSKGASATTTLNFGEMGDATSHACFNTKNTDGADISFYFVGTSMVVENNVCQ